MNISPHIKTSVPATKFMFKVRKKDVKSNFHWRFSSAFIIDCSSKNITLMVPFTMASEEYLDCCKMVFEKVSFRFILTLHSIGTASWLGKAGKCFI